MDLEEEDKQLCMFDDLKGNIKENLNYINNYKSGLLDDEFELLISEKLGELLKKDIKLMTLKELEQYTKCVKTYKELLDNQQQKQYNLQFKVK